jgi:hypothetical protein
LGGTCKVKRQRLVGNLNTSRVLVPSLVEDVGVKLASLSNFLHILMEIESMVLVFPNPKSYYVVFRLQTCIEVGVAPPMIGILIEEEQEFFNMWQIDNLEFREYLLYSLICGYFIFDPKAYGKLKFMVGCPRLYAFKYYCKLEIAFHQYASCKSFCKLDTPSFSMEYHTKSVPMVLDYAQEQLEQWKHSMAICHQLVD